MKDRRYKRKIEAVNDEEYKEINGIISGEIKTTRPKRFKTLVEYINDEEIEELKRMDYREFLRTNYWIIVGQYKLLKANFRCELCFSKDNLEVHHKTYIHHGEEHNYLEELIVLCRDCHQRFHDKLDQ